MPNIFISYRREDSAYAAGIIRDRLSRAFSGTIFMDVDTIPIGVDYRDHIGNEVAQCDLMLALIGDNWLQRRFPAPHR